MMNGFVGPSLMPQNTHYISQKYWRACFRDVRSKTVQYFELDMLLDNELYAQLLVIVLVD